MSDPKVEDFIKKVLEDEEFRNKLKSSSSMEEALEFTRAAGFNFEIAEIVEHMLADTNDFKGFGCY